MTKDHSVVRDHRDVLAETTLRVFAYNNANLTGPEMVDRLDELLCQFWGGLEGGVDAV